MYGDEYATPPHAMESGADASKEWQRAFSTQDGGTAGTWAGFCRPVDDIIIGSGTEDMSEDELIKAHTKDLRRVLDVLDHHQMVCKLTKASLFVKEVQFAGHVVRHVECRPMPGKLAA